MFGFDAMPRSIVPLEQILDNDLATIRADLREEFATMSGKRLLITGGGGFLGYYLVQSVLSWNRSNPRSRPISLTVFDNYMRGIPAWLEALRGDPDLTLERYDLTLPLPPDMSDFDYIVHAAGIASPKFYRAQPLKCIDANLNGLRNLLDHCVRQRDRGHAVQGFLFYSSSEIYGDPAGEAIPTPETYRGNVSCTGPRACYDESKRMGETLCVTFASHESLPVKIARPFNNYGPGLKITDGRVIPDFARDVLAGRDILMFSDGSPTRTFCYATDAVAGYYKVLVRGHRGEPYNIGVDRPEITMRDLAGLVVDTARDLFDYRGRVVLGKSAEADYLVDNPNRRCPVLEKARTHLDYQPKVLIDEGIYRSLVWYHYHRQAEVA